MLGGIDGGGSGGGGLGDLATEQKCMMSSSISLEVGGGVPGVYSLKYTATLE